MLALVGILLMGYCMVFHLLSDDWALDLLMLLLQLFDKKLASSCFRWSLSLA